MKSNYYLPRWNPLRWLGFYEVDGIGIRGRLFDVYLRKFILALRYSVYHERAHVEIGLVFVDFFIPAPMLITQRAWTEDWNASFGFTTFGNGIHFNWRGRCKIVEMPWAWTQVRHTWLRPDGSSWRDVERMEFRPPDALREKHPFTYIRASGAIQQATATVHGEERELRWRGATWLPWPRKVLRAIWCEFDNELGEGAGSWKGGTVGAGTDWREGESMQRALRRMEREAQWGR